MKPIQNLLQKNLAMFENLEDPQFLANYFAMELWVNDNIPVAGETFREFVKDFYQGNRLVRGEFRLGGRRVDLAPDHLSAALADGARTITWSRRRRRRASAPHVGSTDVESVDDRRRARGPGGRRQGAAEHVARGDALARRAAPLRPSQSTQS